MTFVADVLPALTAVSAVAGAAGSVAGFAGSRTQASGTRAAGQAAEANANYAAQVARNNAGVAEQNAKRSEEAGLIASENKSLEGAATAGRIKVGQASSGVDVNTGSARAVQESQRIESRLDSATVLSNAELAAYGYRTQGTSFQAQADLDVAQGKDAAAGADIAASGTELAGDAGLLASVSSLGSKWAQFGPAGAKSTDKSSSGNDTVSGFSGDTSRTNYLGGNS